KLALISALVHEPKLLILDEPFVGLDPKASVILKDIMREICAKGGAILFSTHVLDVAERLCSKVAIMKDGVLVASGEMDRIVKPGQTLESIFMEVINHENDAVTD
ncbi:MAG: ABC transporter ATP-binding protein, partial [Butyrivibrio sp.]|nr:ABC transporter ATP-binding protein [Butyrivibrio sp.]